MKKIYLRPVLRVKECLLERELLTASNDFPSGTGATEFDLEIDDNGNWR